MPTPPGPSSLENLFLARRLLKDPRAPIEECAHRYGQVFQTRVPGDGLKLVPLVWLLGRDGNERVLSPKYKDDFSWYEGYRFTMEPLFGRRILFLLDDDPDGKDEHRQRYRLLVPAFHPRLDDTYLSKMRTIIEQHLFSLPISDDAPIDIQGAIKRLTFHIIARLLLGAEEQDLPRLTALFEELGLGLYSVVHLPIPGLPFFRAQRARQAISAYLQAQLDAYRRGEKNPPPMLAGMLDAQRMDSSAISDASIIAELIAFLYAGYDTSSSLLTSVMVALGENPSVYRHLRDAIRAPDAGADLPYLDAVLLEAERLYPPLHFALRGVRKDFSYNGFDIKAGSKVTYSPYYTGRISELFPDPEAFNPSRFLDDNGALRRPAPYTVVGFGGGHRMCIGKRLSLLEMRLFLTELLENFDLDFPAQSPDAVYFNPALQRKDGYRIFMSISQRRRGKKDARTDAEKPQRRAAGDRTS